MRNVMWMRRSERGAAAIVVAISLVAVFAAAMLSIDAGMMWRQRRALLTATDATALSEARTAALALPGTGSACSSEWKDVIARNAGGDAEPLTCAVKRNVAFGSGIVEVEARITSQVVFGKVLGVADSKPFASSVARFGYVSVMRWLRPIGLCIQNTHVAEWLALRAGGTSPAAYNALRGSGPAHPVYTGAGVVHRVSYTKDQPDACGEKAPGNWGFIDFNGGSNSNAEMKQWMLNGYEDGVAVTDCYPNNSVPAEPCPADTGSGGASIDDELADVIKKGDVFAIPLFDDVQGSGSTTSYRISGFLGVRLYAMRLTGAQADRYFDMEFVSLIVRGNCCQTLPPGPDTGIRAIRLCSVDHDSRTASERCG